MGADRDDDQSTDGGKNNETTYEVLKAEGDVLFSKREFLKARTSYTHALDLIGDKDDKDQQGGKPKGGELSKEEEKLLKDKNDILVTRSKCNLMLGDAAAALRDSEDALKEDGHFIKALYQKAEALYLQGDFENALVCYHRGNFQRPELEEFRQGINKATEAINNSIGEPESVKLEKKGLDHFYSKQDEEERSKQKKGAKTGKTYGKPGQKDNKPKEKQRPRSCKDTKTIKELLGDLYQDREYLDKLLREEESTDQKTESSQKIQDLCIEGINYLDSRTDFWRQQKPMYARKRDKMLQRQQMQRGKHGSQTMRVVVKNIEDIDDAQANGEYERSLKKCKRSIKQVESLNEDECPDKPEILASLYSYTGNAYLETGKYDLALDYHKRDLEIGDKNDLEDSKSRALDNLGRVYARTGSYDKAVEVWEQKLPMSKSDLEKTWLYHEIGRCYLELEQFPKAKEYGESSLNAAKGADDDVWQLNASVLIAQSEVKLEDYNSAVSSFELALDMAKVQGDKPAEEAIKRALDEVNKKIAQVLRDGDGQQSDRDSDQKSDKAEEQRQLSDQDDKKSDKGSEHYTSPRSDDNQTDKDKTDSEAVKSDTEDDKPKSESGSEKKEDNTDKESDPGKPAEEPTSDTEKDKE